jgi:hypothetical protein
MLMIFEMKVYLELSEWAVVTKKVLLSGREEDHNKSVKM